MYVCVWSVCNIQGTNGYQHAMCKKSGSRVLQTEGQGKGRGLWQRCSAYQNREKWNWPEHLEVPDRLLPARHKAAQLLQALDDGADGVIFILILKTKTNYLPFIHNIIRAIIIIITFLISLFRKRLQIFTLDSFLSSSSVRFSKNFGTASITGRK